MRAKRTGNRSRTARRTPNALPAIRPALIRHAAQRAPAGLLVGLQLQSRAALALVHLGEFPGEVPHHIEGNSEDVLPWKSS
jgi:hypothetical protein